MPRILTSFVAVLMATWAGQVFANNNFFLPGDAFYYAEPNHDWFEDLVAEEHPIVMYQRPRVMGGRFCGYSGYNQLRLDHLSPEFRANLVNAYRELRNRYPQRIETHQESTLKMENGKLVPVGDQQDSRIEHNLVSMLIYNRSFDLAKFRPLFRYNEHWADAAASFGHPRDGVAYDFFIDDAQSITDDWRDSALVEPLGIEEPAGTNQSGKRKNVLISIDCRNVQIILFPTAHYEDIAFPESEVVIQEISGKRAQVTAGQTLGGGLFSIQEESGKRPWSDSPGDGDETTDDNRVPFFGYRATDDRVEALKPEKKTLGFG